MLDGYELNGGELNHDVAVAVRPASGSGTAGRLRLPRPVFSVTKMFVATSALRLAESGRLDLDADVSRRGSGDTGRADPA